MTSDALQNIEGRVNAWSKTVNPQRRADAIVLIEEIRRLKKELERAYERPDTPGPV